MTSTVTGRKRVTVVTVVIVATRQTECRTKTAEAVADHSSIDDRQTQGARSS